MRGRHKGGLLERDLYRPVNLFRVGKLHYRPREGGSTRWALAPNRVPLEFKRGLTIGRVIMKTLTDSVSGMRKLYAVLAAAGLLFVAACGSDNDAAIESAGSPGGGTWEPLGSGFTGDVRALTTYEGELIAGGFMGSMNYVARWDGSTWQSLGGGLPGAGFVEALIGYEGDLIAGGSFSTALGQMANGIARWDGAQWQPMGAGVWGSVMGGDAMVWSFTVHDGQLIAGGTFATAGGQPASGVARWDGAEWQPMGTVMTEVRALTVYEGDLIAGGSWDIFGEPGAHIARWDGSDWQKMGTEISAFALVVHEGELFAAGLDWNDSNAVSRWSGSAWEPVGAGTAAWGRSLVVYDGDLIAGGDFPATLGEGTNHIARWDGAAWQAMGSGMNSSVWALTVHDGDLIAAGSFTTADGRLVNRIARWTGE
jgi:hypothetical protein